LKNNHNKLTTISDAWRNAYGKGYEEGLHFLLNANVLLERDVERICFEISEKRPIQYIIGNWDFYNGNYEVNSDVLIPRPETETLIEHIENSKLQPKSILDLGTGTGCIAIELSKIFPKATVDAVDLSIKAISIAKTNAKKNNANVRFLNSNWYQKVSLKYDLIVSNPPYVDRSTNTNESLKFEPEEAIFSDENGLKDLRIIISQSKDYLNYGGIIFLEHSPEQKKIIKNLLKKNGFRDVSSIKDLKRTERFTFGKLE
jgi:release factor glutamine methyltransferase